MKVSRFDMLVCFDDSVSWKTLGSVEFCSSFMTPHLASNHYFLVGKIIIII